MWKETHLMEVGETEGRRFGTHPLTNMSSLTQSHLIDCPLLLCNLGGFEFYERNETRNEATGESFQDTRTQTQECVEAYLIFFSKGWQLEGGQKET